MAVQLGVMEYDEPIDDDRAIPEVEVEPDLPGASFMEYDACCYSNELCVGSVGSSLAGL